MTFQVFSLQVFQRAKVIRAHEGSVLGLCLSKDVSLLFTSASDRFIKVCLSCVLAPGVVH